MILRFLADEDMAIVLGNIALGPLGLLTACVGSLKPKQLST